MNLEFGYSPVGCVKLVWVGSQGDRGSRVEVHVVSSCSTRDELALLLRPLFRQGVLYIPSEDTLEGVGESFALCVALADQSLVLRAQARPVDPFAYGLVTGGYPGFAVKLTELDARGRDFVTELTRSFDGTLPFGVPTSVIGDRRILCRLQYEEQQEPTVLPVKAMAPITEVASAGSTGITRPRSSLGEEEIEESTTIIGEDTMLSMVEEESTAVADENERTDVAHSNTKLLANDSEIEEATAIGLPAGLHSLAPPLPAPTTPAITPATAPDATAPAQAVPAQSAPALIPDANGNLIPNPLYNGIPSSILLGPADRPVTRTDFITAAASLNRPVIISSLAAAIVGLLTGYLLWGSRDTAPAVASKVSDQAAIKPDPVDAVDDPPATKLVSATPVTASQGTAHSKTSPTPTTTSPAASPCRVSITTSPPGAALFHKGAFVGASPYDGPMFCDATRVDIRHPYFQAAEAVFAMQEGKASAKVELARPKFLVTVKSVPGKAIIKRDGAILGRTPMSIRLPAFESTQLRIFRKGFAAQTIEVTPTKYKSAINLRLARKR